MDKTQKTSELFQSIYDRLQEVGFSMQRTEAPDDPPSASGKWRRAGRISHAVAMVQRPSLIEMSACRFGGWSSGEVVQVDCVDDAVALARKALSEEN